MDINLDLLTTARVYARKRFNELREMPEFWYCHEGHAVARALEDTEKKFPKLETYGVEGDCHLNGENSIDIQYLNTGDTYAPTIVYYKGRFRVTSWGDIVEQAENEENETC